MSDGDDVQLAKITIPAKNGESDDDQLTKITIPGKNNESSSDDVVFYNDAQNNTQNNTQNNAQNNVQPLNTPWNDKIQLLLKRIGEKSSGYRWMHDQEEQFYEKLNFWFKIIEIILLAIIGTVTSGEFVGLLADANLRENIVILMIVTSIQLVIIFLLTIVIGIKEFGQFSDKMFDHSNNSTKFNEIVLNIRTQLSFNIDDRENDNAFLKEIIKSYNDLMSVSHKIRKRTQKRYIKATENQDIYRPLVVGNFDNIEIIIDERHYNNVELNSQESNSGELNSGEVSNNNNEGNNYKAQYEINRWLKAF